MFAVLQSRPLTRGQTWHRGREWCRLVAPRRKPLSILGIGGSVSTFIGANVPSAGNSNHNSVPPVCEACASPDRRTRDSHCGSAHSHAASGAGIGTGAVDSSSAQSSSSDASVDSAVSGLPVIGAAGVLRAEVVVVHEWDEFNAMAAADKLAGKCVLFNAPFRTYDHCKDFRSQGASRAAAAGACAVLVRSIAPFSLYSPHTGMHVMWVGNTRRVACFREIL